MDLSLILSSGNSPCPVSAFSFFSRSVSPRPFLLVRFVWRLRSAQMHLYRIAAPVVYWLFRNGGFCLGVPHKRGFALIRAVSPLPFSLLAWLVVIPVDHARPPLKSTPASSWQKKGKGAAICLLLSYSLLLYLFFLLFSLVFLWFACFEGSELTRARAHVHAHRCYVFFIIIPLFFCPES